jgi:putative FmdB family regulatory protein
MPLYEYRCAACAHRFEALVSRRDEAAPHCPQCGGSEVERMLSAFTVTRGERQARPGPCGAADCSCGRE